MASVSRHHFLSFLRGLRRRRQVGGRVQCRRFEAEPRSHQQVRVGRYGTDGSTALNLTACLLLRAGPTPTDRGDLKHPKTLEEVWGRDWAVKSYFFYVGFWFDSRTGTKESGFVDFFVNLRRSGWVSEVLDLKLLYSQMDFHSCSTWHSCWRAFSCSFVKTPLLL